ncbi:lytic murein transglycosylase, partial [Aeromonas allosaccharophila]
EPAGMTTIGLSYSLVKISTKCAPALGAMGQVQFMPSSFLKYAVDQDGDGRKDLWGNLADVFGSAANYLHQNGWREDQTWGRRVRVPDSLNSALFGLETRKLLSAWQALGVRHRADASVFIL